MGEKCNARVNDPGLWSRSHRCTRNAVIAGYCRLHHPDAVQARKDVREVKWKAEREIAQRRYALGQLGEKMVVALIAIRDGHNDPREVAREALEGNSYAAQTIGGE